MVRRRKKAELKLLIISIAILFIATMAYNFLMWLSSLSLLTWISIGVLITGLIWLKQYRNKQRKVREMEMQRLELQRLGTLNQLKKRTSLQFEYYISGLFQQMGYDAHVTKPTGDGGKDILIYKDNFFAIAECKRLTKSKVTRPQIQKFHSAIMDCKAEKGYFITTSDFTNQAISYVIDKPIYLVNGERLIHLIEEITSGGIIDYQLEDFLGL
ncbi:restriction endonuclease [Virgibacillus sp. MG-45]|uniref:restriction endonuclease n=1 Tax=Virgibacillus sp. MG-45 TaxID=3102791 RepID=UPI002EDAC9E3